jgi:Family of unknown function (DUF6328)
VTGRLSVLAMLPFALSIGLTFYVVLEPHAGSAFAIAARVLFFSSAILFWFGIEQFMKNTEEHMSKDGVHEHNTPIDARIEHLLTEARVLLPGAQAMLGFQFTIMLTKAFDALPDESKLIHVAALSLIAMAVILLMTPAAIHRLTFKGEDSERFHNIGSLFVVASAAPLGLGISADMYVAIAHATASPVAGAIMACLSVIMLSILWFVQPFMLRSKASRRRGPFPEKKL